ncbi:hypothetical protein C0995_015516 [Termitomyces sp. Mi166|nr:hypothetical protein C0995_015516 [Termitomyces sp. Mi166\
MSHNHHHQPPSPSYPSLNYTHSSKWIKSLTKDHIRNFHGRCYSDINLFSALFMHRIDSLECVKLQIWSVPEKLKSTFEEAMKQKFKPAKKE